MVLGMNTPHRRAVKTPMKTCPDEIEPCPHDGARLAEPREERECPHCAELILRKARVCKHCGRDVEPVVGTSVVAQAPPQSISELPTAQAQASIKMKYLFLLIGMVMGGIYQYHIVMGNEKFNSLDFMLTLPWGIAGFAVGAVLDGLKKK